MLNAIAIDDEPIALNIVRQFSAGIDFIDLKQTFTNAFNALPYLEQNDVHLLFLDIKMPDISGIEFLRSIPRAPMVIFTTGYSEHAVQSFELDAIDFLLKPFSEDRFRKACEKANRLHHLASSHANAKEEYLFLKTGAERVRAEFKDILYIESQGNYMQFVLRDKKILSRLTMAETQALLPKDIFLRIHRSVIINTTHLTKIEKAAVWINNHQLPVGPNYGNTLMDWK